MLGRLRQDLTAALRARDKVAVSALRSAIAAIENAESVDVMPAEPRSASSEHIAGATAGVGSSDVDLRVLSEPDVIAIVRDQVEGRIEAADEYVKLGRVDQAAQLRREAEVLRKYLPARDVQIRSDTITLGQLLKLEGMIDSGAGVKAFLSSVPVWVNGEREARRGRKLHVDDIVQVEELELRLTSEDLGMRRARSPGESQPSG